MFERGTLLAQYWRARQGWRFASRDGLERHQARRIARFMRGTLARSPYYRAYAGRALADYPVMTKAVMLANFAAINTAGISFDDAMALAIDGERTRDFTPRLEGGVSVGLSTGTSGTRGLFLVSERERMAWAGIMLGRMLPGSLLSAHKIAFFLRANNNLYESVAGRGRIAFRFFDLMTPLADHHRALQSYAPTVLIAPAQVLRELAKLESLARGRGECAVTPTRIISVGEVLFDDDRAVITAAFRTRVDQVYQCTEGFLGYTCAAGRLHLNEAFVHIEPEWLDDELLQFHPIITDFSRTTQPIVRFRLDDVLTTDPRRCPCGSSERAIARIEGRADDIVVLARADGTRVQVMPDYVVRALAGAGDAMADFRVEQRADGCLHVLIDAPAFGVACAQAAAAIGGLAATLGVVAPRLTFGTLSAGDVMAKRRRVMRDASVAL